jgi:hypothetical protein
VISPGAVLAVVLVWVASVLGAGWWAYGAGRDKEIADQSRVTTAVAAAGAEAASAVAAAVPKIQVRNTTIRQTLEKEVHERPVYRDCVGDPRARQLLNDTIGAVTAGASAPGAVELPASGPAR